MSHVISEKEVWLILQKSVILKKQEGLYSSM